MYKLMHNHIFLFLLSITKKKTRKSLTASVPDCLCQPGAMSWSGVLMTKNNISVLAIPGCYIKFPGSLHPLRVWSLWSTECGQCGVWRVWGSEECGVVSVFTVECRVCALLSVKCGHLKEF